MSKRNYNKIKRSVKKTKAQVLSLVVFKNLNVFICRHHFDLNSAPNRHNSFPLDLLEENSF